MTLDLSELRELHSDELSDIGRSGNILRPGDASECEGFGKILRFEDASEVGDES